MGLQTPASPSYNWVFKWDGHNPFWPGRITNYAAVYPTGTAPHTRGQHWSTANMRIWDQIGGEDTDRVVHEALRLTGVSSTQPQAAQAAMQAGRNMDYAQADLDIMFASYNTQGFNVTMPLPTASEGGPGSTSALELSTPAPNPAEGTAAMILRAAEAQEVQVVLVDVLGRTVATIFDGALGAGEARSLEVGLTDLPAGVYVIRATGHDASVARGADDVEPGGQAAASTSTVRASPAPRAPRTAWPPPPDDVEQHHLHRPAAAARRTSAAGRRRGSERGGERERGRRRARAPLVRDRRRHRDVEAARGVAGEHRVEVGLGVTHVPGGLHRGLRRLRLVRRATGEAERLQHARSVSCPPMSFQIRMLTVLQCCPRVWER